MNSIDQKPGGCKLCFLKIRVSQKVFNTLALSLENDKSQFVDTLFALEDVESEVERREKLFQTTGAIEALSPRKREVMELVMQGNTEQEISQKLKLSASTVRAYLTNARKAIKDTIL